MATSKPNPPNTTCTTTISSPFTGLPKLNWWGLVDLYQWEGFWYQDIVLEAAMAAKSSFTALDDDVFVAASPKTGSTWLKALVASIIHRGDGDGGGDCEGGDEDDEDADDPLRYHHPNDLVPSLELQVCRKNGKLDLPNMASPRLFRTHISYSLLPESIKTSSCKIVYITRDPKDVFVSLWHFMNTQRSPEQGPFPFDDAFKSFCNGFHSFGPFHEHVLQFWNESLKSPKKILSMSSSFDHSSSESEQSSSSSSSSDETQTTLKMKVIPDPPASWHPPGSLPTTSRSGSTSHGSVSAGPSSSQATQKQTRGPTYVHGQWGTSEDGILKVVPNELNQVVEGHTSLASHLGVLARDGSLAPLTFMTWHYVPKQNKDNIWREIKAHTDADESMKRTIMASFGKKWRDWKSRVKTIGYKPFKNDAERLAHRPDRVHEDQWRALVYYWGTQSASKSSKKNRKIRKKKTLHHRTGRKPFSVVRLEETKKNNGVPASRSQVWMAAYMKDGMSNSDSVNEVMTQMNELAEHMEGSSTDPAALQEQIFTQVMGPERPGRVRTFGLGPSPTDVFGGGYRRSQEQNRLFQTQVQEQVQEQLHRYQMQFESKMNEVMEKQIQAIRTDFQSRIQFLESQLQAAGVPVDPVVAPSNPLHRQQVVDSLSSHPTVRPMSHQQQSHAFSSQEVHLSKKEKKNKKKKKN